MVKVFKRMGTTLICELFDLPPPLWYLPAVE